MGNISGQHKLWKKEVTRAKQNIITAIGDGLLAAAYVCYCGPLDDQTREKLLEDWLEHFEQEMFIDVMASKLYPKLYSKSSKLKSKSETGESQDTDFWVAVQAYEAKVRQTEFNYSSGLMTEANAESLDDVMDYDSDNEDETGKVLMVRKNFQLLKVLSSYDELSEWRMKNYPVDTRSLQNACLINMCKWNFRSLWPLLVDPDGQAELWVRNLYLLYQEKEKLCDNGKNLPNLNLGYKSEESVILAFNYYSFCMKSATNINWCKVSDCSWDRPEGSLFNSYYTEV